MVLCGRICMAIKKIIPFALAPADMGCRNHILGAFRAIAGLMKQKIEPEKFIVIPDGSTSYTEVRQPLVYTRFKSYKEFKTKFFGLLDEHFRNLKQKPKVFITVYNPTESHEPGRNADVLCRAVKEYYKEHRLGFVMTVVLSSKFYKYRYVDLINIPKHLMTFALRIRLIRNKVLRKKVLVTMGTIHNFTAENVANRYEELQNKMKELKKDKALGVQVKKLVAFFQKKKRVVFCLGGRVEGSEIVFDINYAQKLYSDAEKLVAAGYGIVFVNGPRTPNGVTDYLYEKSLENPNIIFQNCKRIAQIKEDYFPSAWRIYSGPHEAEFIKQQELGNVYPAVLGVGNTLAVHTMDSYSACETASAAIPTAVSCRGIYIDQSIRYDCTNLAQLLCPKYAVDFDDFVNMACNMKIEPKDLHPRQLSSPLKVFAETVAHRLKQLS